ncbi:DUF6188 family protein [Streptosporangium saharense]|uniref:Uncharacterized protein n=1 Tax=Streptosporangium saharense TaxID=1706840 RepID=A0A7W7VK61_9ACTN|nr:DUF6188 family protein [Streptosporangium saharense]MBB4913351.1 hypothetical protein [Streptosporangium saharense]
MITLLTSTPNPSAEMMKRVAVDTWQDLHVGAPTELTELKDRWLLPYRGMHVIQVRLDRQLTLLLNSGAYVDIGGEAMLSHGPLSAPDATTVRLVPERREIAPVLTLFGAMVLSSVAFKSGALRLVFSTGAHLNVQRNHQYEAWSAHGPDTLFLVCQPDGDLAVWR